MLFGYGVFFNFLLYLKLIDEVRFSLIMRGDSNWKVLSPIFLVLRYSMRSNDSKIGASCKMRVAEKNEVEHFVINLKIIAASLSHRPSTACAAAGRRIGRVQ